MSDEFSYFQDVAAQRAYLVGALAHDLDNCADKEGKRIIREMMQKLTDTIITPKTKAAPPVLAFNGKPIDDPNPSNQP